MSHATDAAVGMMDGAYFTSRNDILSFLNDLLDLNLTKIEQTASGAVACQLTDYLFPGSVPMSKVNWAAKSSFEYVDNYKLLQKAFNKHKIRKHVDVDKLIRGKYQDNLEFCQWLKAFFDQTAPMLAGGREGYDPVAVRARGKGGKAVGRGGGGRKGSSRPAAATRSAGGGAGGGTRAAHPARTKSTAPARAGGSRPDSASSSSSRASAAKENTANASSSSRAAPAPQRKAAPAASSSAASSAKAAKLQDENRTLRSRNADLTTRCAALERASAEVEHTLGTVEGERDFYFEKLRGIELMLQVHKEREEAEAGSGNVGKVMDDIFKVMYATMDDDVAVDDEGNLVGDVTLGDGIGERAEDDLLGDDDEDLLTSGSNDDAKAADHPVSSDDDDDDELLTSGLDDEGLTAKGGGVGAFGAPASGAAVVHDDDDFSDDDLLAD